MKKFLLLGLVLCLMAAANAQKVYFIYLQSDNASAFYLKTGDQVLSSTAEGYLIVPKLVDSTYQFVVGKPGRPQMSEARFTITINKADRGFLLRETGNALSLFDLQTLAVINASSSGNSGGTSFIKKTDGFTTLLSIAADDSSLLNVAVVTKAEKPKKEQPAPAAKAEPKIVQAETITEETKTAKAEAATQQPDSTENTATVSADKPKEIIATAKPKEADTTTAAAEPAAAAPRPEPQAAKVEVGEKAPEYKRSVVTRRSESSTSEGFGLVFLDNYNGAVDTVRLVIPNPKIMFEATTQQIAADSARFLSISSENNTGVAASTTATAKEQKETKKFKRACRKAATENDFMKLRRYMVARTSEDAMITEAKYFFQNRCFSTEQIRSLGALFLTPKGKYEFFETAYPYVTDQEQFAALQKELWDDAYINRFKALMAN